MLSLFALTGVLIVVLGASAMAWQQVEQRMQEAHESAALIAEEFVSARLDQLKTVADFLVVAEQTQPILRTALAQDPSLQSLYLLDSEGTVLEQQHRAGHKPRSVLADEGWIDSFRNSGSFIGTPHQGTGIVQVVNVGQPIPHQTGMPAHALLATLDLTRLWTRINRIRVGESGAVFLTDNDNRLLTHRNIGLLAQRPPLNTLYNAPIESDQRINLVNASPGGWMLVSRTPLNVGGWSLLVQIPAASLAGWLFGGVCVVVFTLGACWLVIRRTDHFVDAEIVQPLTTLEQRVDELKESRQALAVSQDMISLVDRHYIYRLVNESYLTTFGKTYHQIVGQSVPALLGEASFQETVKPKFDRCLAGETLRYQQWFDTAQGRRYLDVIYNPYRAENGWIEGVLVSTRDVTDTYRAQEQLRLAASVFTSAREGILITDAWGRIREVNQAFCRITGLPPESVDGQDAFELSGLPDSKRVRIQENLRACGHWSGEVENCHADGTGYVAMLTITAVQNEAGDISHYVVLFSDITEQKRYQQQLELIANYDALTNLPNRRLLADKLHQAMALADRTQGRLAVVYLDLDGFKAINDQLGHDIGDRLLLTLASRMKEALRPGDTIARLGGDEFVAVLVGLDDDPRSCEPMITALLDAASRPVELDDKTLEVTASLGVTFYPQEEGQDADQLLRQSDQAMYQAKLAGKNRFHLFDTEHDRSMRGYNENIGRMREALENDEFVLHFQPKVNMHTGEILGAEALIRWQHPERGLLPPGAFLPDVENHPLAIELGEWVIESALTQLEHWHRHGLDISVSINVGALELQQKDFVERVQCHLVRHPGVPARSLEIEVLETTALEDMDHVSNIMKQCRALDIHFALDDFGTGYSTLAYLKNLPARSLKIDRSFVRDILDDPEDLTILDGVLGLARAFRRRAIAEGVETEQQGLLLLQLGCELGQGYGIARPMSAKEFELWTRKWRPFASWTRQKPINRDRMPLIFASVEHRAWVNNAKRLLAGEKNVELVLENTECRLGRWLHSDGVEHYGEHPAFRSIHKVHDELHRHVIMEMANAPVSDDCIRQLDLNSENLLTLLRALLDDGAYQKRHPAKA